MPNLLKKLMTRTARPNQRNQPVQDQIDLLESPPPSATTAQAPNDLDLLAAQVLGKIKSQGQAGNAIDQSQVLGALRGTGQAPPSDSAPKPKERKSKTDKLKKMAFGPEPAYPQRKRETDDGRKSLESLIASISAIEKLQTDGVKGQLSDKVLGHCLILLEPQRDEIKDAMVYMERGRYPALKTLKQVYDRILAGLTGLESLTPTDAKAELNTLVQLLEEAPDYLIDTFLIELIIHHAGTLDTTLASEVRRIHDEAVAQPGDLKTFRRAAEGIVAYACAIPSEDLDDELGREAYRTIGKLVKQLKLRVDSGEQAMAKAARADNIVKPSSDDNLQALAASALESRFGTGPIPSAPTPVKTRAPSPTPSAASDSSLDSVSLYEYRNQILTASALDLIMRQEALATADSSGQYAGDVSWDDLRKAWIPKNVIKLKDTDLAAGEIPSNNPDDFEIKGEDDFGNKIGWTERHEMYYIDEDPKFEI